MLYPYYSPGLDGVLQNRGSDFSGITNGIDMQVFDPAKMDSIAQNYTAKTLREGKTTNKLALQQRVQLAASLLGLRVRKPKRSHKFGFCVDNVNLFGLTLLRLNERSKSYLHIDVGHASKPRNLEILLVLTLGPIPDSKSTAHTVS